jgi:23S rRNA (cytidine1920-2'-O)/16S rRNA (cytidine1409-2'-O)-methyltransferase
VKRVRLDALLSERGVFPSRARAAASVLAGDVLLLPERRKAQKPGQLVPEDAQVEVSEGPQYVSRGGIKLANALAGLGLDVAGRRALDVGASTGGFTDCLLQRGVERVVCVDVAYGQLDWRLRTDSRVTVIERRNARSLRREELPYAPDLIVIDVSFISLRKVLPATLACAAEPFDCLALVKPQFEVGREHVGSSGVVRDPGQRRRALVEVGREDAWERRSSAMSAPGCPGPRETGRRSCGSLRVPEKGSAITNSNGQRGTSSLEFIPHRHGANAPAARGDSSRGRRTARGGSPRRRRTALRSG